MEDKEREEKENKIVEDYGKNARIILDIINKKRKKRKKKIEMIFHYSVEEKKWKILQNKR